MKVPDNIQLINIPAYSPELNPCEKIWQYIKSKFKNQFFDNMEDLKSWLHKQVRDMQPHTIMSITHNQQYIKPLLAP